VALLLLVLALLHLAHTESPATRGRKVPAHFTIPIFSPFTSVVRTILFLFSQLVFTTRQVEHETSVIGSKTLAVFALILAGLAYFVFRHWFARRRQ
jgi:uncharacterized membrane protein YidH (DUF202 family)